MIKIFYILILILSFNSAYAINFSGKVINKETKKPLFGATIKLEGTSKGAISDKNGEYDIRNLKSGKYRILVSYIGFELIIKEIEVNEASKFDFELIETSLNMNTITTIGRKDLQAVQEVPISIATMSREEVNIRGTKSLENALQYVPGLEVNRDNISIRGSSGFTFGIGSRVALLLDGSPLLAGDNGDMKFEALPLFNLERIEIIKGASSALYGTSAIGGVINIVTQAPKEEGELNFRLMTGVYLKPSYTQWEYSNSLNTNKAFDISYSKKFDNFNIITSGGYYDRDNFRYFNNQKQFNFFTKLGYQLSDNFSFNLSGNLALVNYDDWVFWRSLNQPFMPPIGSDSVRINSNKYNILFDAKYIFDENNFLIIKSGVFLTKMTNNLALDNVELRKSDALTFNNDFQFSSRLDKSFFITYGFNITNNKVRSITFKDHDQSIYSIYSQAEYSGIDKLIITLGARLDKENTDEISSKIATSPKLGLLYKVNDKFNVRTSIGAGFRAPVIAERYSSVKFLGFQVRPDSSLRPEKSISYEIGSNFEFNLGQIPFYLDLALFQNDLTDLIDPDFPDKTKAEVQFRNITKAKIRGLELNIRTFLFGFLGFETGFTAMDPKDLDLNQTLKYRSKFLLTNKFLIPISNNFQVQADYRFKAKNETIDERLAFGIKDTDARVDVHVVDARLIYKAKDDLNLPITFTFSCNNLFNYYYTELVGNMASTRFLNLQIDYKLN